MQFIANAASEKIILDLIISANDTFLQGICHYVGKINKDDLEGRQNGQCEPQLLRGFIVNSYVLALVYFRSICWRVSTFRVRSVSQRPYLLYVHHLASALYPTVRRICHTRGMKFLSVLDCVKTVDHRWFTFACLMFGTWSFVFLIVFEALLCSAFFRITVVSTTLLPRGIAPFPTSRLSESVRVTLPSDHSTNNTGCWSSFDLLRTVDMPNSPAVMCRTGRRHSSWSK